MFGVIRTPFRAPFRFYRGDKRKTFIEWSFAKDGAAYNYEQTPIHPFRHTHNVDPLGPDDVGELDDPPRKYGAFTGSLGATGIAPDATPEEIAGNAPVPSTLRPDGSLPPEEIPACAALPAIALGADLGGNVAQIAVAAATVGLSDGQPSEPSVSLALAAYTFLPGSLQIRVGIALWGGIVAEKYPTVCDIDGDPSWDDIRVLAFDQDSGFALGHPTAPTATISLVDADLETRGVVNAEAQTFDGLKSFPSGIVTSILHLGAAQPAARVDVRAVGERLEVYGRKDGDKLAWAVRTPAVGTDAFLFERFDPETSSTLRSSLSVSDDTGEKVGVWGTLPDGTKIAGGLVYEIGAGGGGGGGGLDVAAGSGITVVKTSTTATVSVDFGTNPGQVRPATDPAYSDARIPLPHHLEHQIGGSDPLRIDTLAAPLDIVNCNVSLSAHGLCPKLSGDPATFLDGTGVWRAPVAGGMTGPASGDLSGNYPGPTVAKVQGRVMVATAPTDGQAWLWDAGSAFWKPGSLNGDVNGPLTTNVLGNGVVSNAKLATMPGKTIKGNAAVGMAAAADLTAAQVRDLLPVFGAAGGSAAAGLVPQPAAVPHPNTFFGLRDTGGFGIVPGQVVAYLNVPADEATASTGYVDLATPESVTYTLDANCMLLIFYVATVYGTNVGQNVFSALYGSGVFVGGSDVYINLGYLGQAAHQIIAFTARVGPGTFTTSVRHQTSVGTGHWMRRMLVVSVLGP